MEPSSAAGGARRQPGTTDGRPCPGRDAHMHVCWATTFGLFQHRDKSKAISFAAYRAALDLFAWDKDPFGAPVNGTENGFDGLMTQLGYDVNDSSGKRSDFTVKWARRASSLH
jgi:hypothetical protein